MPLQVELVSADRRVWSGEASLVVVRTEDGDMGVMPGHAPVLAVLAAGDVKIEPASSDRDEVHAHTGGGFLSVEHDRVTIVADRAAIGAGSARS
ncbi:MAG: F-type H+-transporting ATPase subunit epsilon [Actinomycetota bacterium]|nr:F-type H+-transporting ATPase subunit epsilon [Actinomycetota bacterium]